MALGVPAVGNAQGFRVVGEVVRITPEWDSIPVAGSQVVLHQITRESGSAVDTGVTNRRGQYRLMASVLDTTATYLVSVGYSGLGYFSEPIQTFGATADTASLLVVYDTTHASPNIVLVERHLVVRSAQPDGSRRIVELLVLQNQGATTRIAFDSLQPVWEGALPAEVLQFEVGDSDVSVQAVRQRGDSVVVFAPIPPGDRQLMLSYTVPSSLVELPIPIDPAVATLNLLIEDTSATLAGSPLELRGVEELDDVFFRRFTGGPVAAGQPVAVRFASPPFSLVAYWWVIVLVATMALAGVLWHWLSRQGGPTMAQPGGADAIAAQIAMLDQHFQQRKDGAGDDERLEYERRRSQLKQRLTDALNARP